jgi:hypothetical protein
MCKIGERFGCSKEAAVGHYEVLFSEKLAVPASRLTSG